MICRKNDCFTCPWPECRNDYVKPRYLTTEKDRARMRERGKARYRERKDAGLCARCGKRPPQDGRVNCGECLRKDAARRRALRVNSGGIPRELFDGVRRCKTCGKEEVVPGHKLCRSCYEKSCEALKVARAARGKNELWDRLNSLVYWR